jgi:mRNA-degrading endonuclease toxin of MazEF toxin-antitoxin module
MPMASSRASRACSTPAPRRCPQRRPHSARVFPFQVLLPADETGIHQASKAQADQVRSVSVERIGAVIGRVPTHLMMQVDDALRLHLQL